eukprot:847058-Amphidinium_carterae.1
MHSKKNHDIINSRGTLQRLEKKTSKRSSPYRNFVQKYTVASLIIIIVLRFGTQSFGSEELRKPSSQYITPKFWCSHSNGAVLEAQENNGE